MPTFKNQVEEKVPANWTGCGEKCVCQQLRRKCFRQAGHRVYVRWLSATWQHGVRCTRIRGRAGQRPWGKSRHQDAAEGWGAGTGRRQARGWASWVPRSGLVGTKATLERLTENECQVGEHRGPVETTFSGH